MTSVLITGGAGFIGSNLAQALLDAGHTVSILDDLSTGFRSNIEGLPVSFTEGSILDRPLLEELAGEVSAIVHLAARPSVARSIDDPFATHEVNATGTLNVLASATKTRVEQVIVASSSSVYGDTDLEYKAEDLAPAPRSPYAVSKLATESYAKAFFHSYGLKVLPFRFFNVFGPGQAAGHDYAAVIPAFIHAALTGIALPVHGDGKQTRDFTYVGTVCDTIRSAIEQQVCSQTPVNLAFGTQTSLLTLIELLGEIMGRQLSVNHVESRAGDIRDSKADATLNRSLFPGIDPWELEKGLNETIAWMEQQLDESGDAK